MAHPTSSLPPPISVGFASSWSASREMLFHPFYNPYRLIIGSSSPCTLLTFRPSGPAVSSPAERSLNHFPCLPCWRFHSPTPATISLPSHSSSKQSCTGCIVLYSFGPFFHPRIFQSASACTGCIGCIVLGPFFTRAFFNPAPLPCPVSHFHLALLHHPGKQAL